MPQEARLDELLGYTPQRILLFRALVVGDMLCAIPAARAVRCAYPSAQITLCSLPWATELVSRFPHYFDEFLEFPGFPGLPERKFDAANFPRFLQTAQAAHYDVALQMHGSGSFVNPLIEMLGARRTAGFVLPGEYCPCPETFLTYPEHLPEVERHLELLRFLGIHSQGAALELPVTDDDHRELQSLPAWRQWGESPYVCIHPGARYSSRRWLPERFAKVADQLAARAYRIVLTGTASEAALCQAVADHMTSEPINLCGQTTLGGLAALLTRSRLLICNDTGVSHVAAALRVPSVVVVTGSDPQRWAPLDRRLHRIVMGAVECRPCEHVHCPIGLQCALAVSAEEVLAQATGLLGAEMSSWAVAN